MKIRRPSPAMAVAFLALVLALSGTAFAAVNYARNAGAVDGKSAVGSGASNKRAAGKLVTTRAKGPAKGTIAQKYLDLHGLARGGATASFDKGLPVADNQTLAPETLGVAFGLGTLTVSCADQSNVAGREDPSARFAFANQSGLDINVARTVGRGDAFVAALPNGAQHTWTINGSNTFELHVERPGVNYLVKGTVRQVGADTGDAACVVYGLTITA
jgi:hypothetical protein